jgi:hypothetical protein
MAARNILVVAVAATAWVGCGGGTSERPKVEDLELLAFVDSNADGLSFNDEPRLIHLSDYEARNRPGTRIIMINAAAGWCGPCTREASAMADFAATYEPQGVAILTAVIQNQSGDPADRTFTQLWAETYRLSVPTIIDSAFATQKYFDLGAMPVNMFVDAKTNEILKVATGAETGSDPMKGYRDLLDYYLRQ